MVNLAPLLADLDEWAEDLAEALPIVEAASRQPEGLNLPGVLVQIVDLNVDTLRGDEWGVDLRLLLIAPEQDVIRATDVLVEMLDAVRAYLGHPAGNFTPTTYTNDQGQVLPALAFPHTIRLVDDNA